MINENVATYKFDDYIVDSTDEFNQIIEKVFIKSKGHFIIYKCQNSDDISFEGTEEAHLGYSKIAGRIASITGRFYSELKKHSFFKEQIIYSMAEAIQNNIHDANQILDSLEQRILNIKKREGRLHYLGGAFIVVAINVIISIILILFYGSITNELWKECIFIFWIITSGSLGGMLSISININKLEIDSDSGFLNNFITGISRTLISMIASYFIYFALKSNIILGIINESSTNIYSFLTFGLISGFSETLVPNIINKVEQKSSENL